MNLTIKLFKLTEYKEKAESEFPSQLIVKTEVLPVNQAKPPSNQKEQQEQPQPIKELPNVNENESAKKNQKAVKQQPPETPQPAPPRNIMDPVDIMQKLPKNLEEQLVSKTWQERKTALDQLHGILTDNPRLADNPDYVRVIEQLTRVMQILYVLIKCLFINN
jgi:cytoskeleton-associated protein 5